MAGISIRNLRKSFGQTTAVEDFSLEIGDGELVTFLGPSGCGKTTTLRMIAGFIEPTSGAIHIGDQDVTHQPVHKRNTGMVFQRYALFPHMTVEQNIAFGLQMHKVPAKEQPARIGEALELVRMQHLAHRYPRELSGGQQQRVAIARALVIRPKVFLLDEPLSNLDAKLRLEVREEIRSLQQSLGLTTIFVTHDQEEALAISDRMAIMYDGIVQQIGTPQSLYEQPANRFVAGFLGRMNFLAGRSRAMPFFKSDTGDTLQVAALQRDTRQIGIRPERLRLDSIGLTGYANQLSGHIQAVTYLGGQIDIRFVTDKGSVLMVQAPNTGHEMATWLPLQAGTRAIANFHDSDCIAFPEGTQ